LKQRHILTTKTY